MTDEIKTEGETPETPAEPLGEEESPAEENVENDKGGGEGAI